MSLFLNKERQSAGAKGKCRDPLTDVVVLTFIGRGEGVTDSDHPRWSLRIDIWSFPGSIRTLKQRHHKLLKKHLGERAMVGFRMKWWREFIH